MYDYVNDHRPRLSIPISAIISVRVLTSLEVPLEFSSFQCTGESTSNLQFFEIETFPRVYYLMIKNETELFMWLRSFSHLLTGEVKDISATSTIIPINAPLLSHSININDMYLARPKDWRMKKRSVFNFRRIHFRPPATSRSPLQIVEIALQLVFELVEYDRSINQVDGGRDGVHGDPRCHELSTTITNTRPGQVSVHAERYWYHHPTHTARVVTAGFEFSKDGFRVSCFTLENTSFRVSCFVF